MKNVTSNGDNGRHTHTHIQFIPLGVVKEGKYRPAVGQWESKPQKSPCENSWPTSPPGYFHPRSNNPRTFCNFLFLFVFIAASLVGKKSRLQAEKPIACLFRPRLFGLFMGCSLLWDGSVVCLGILWFIGM